MNFSIMWFSLFHPFLLLSLLRSVGAFVYSCDEVSTIMNSGFEEYAQYACVVTQEGFTNYSLLETIIISFNESFYSLSDIAVNQPGGCVGNTDGTPWTISSDNLELDCDQEFTLLLRSDELVIVKPLTDYLGPNFSLGSGVFVVPQTGMWLNIKSAAGEGNVTVFTGAGSGEAEERYMLQTFPCESIPDWIFSFESVITIEADPTCSSLVQFCSDLSYYSRVSIFRHDRIVVLNSGYSDNLQNREGIVSIAHIKIGDNQNSNVDVNMQLEFDSENSGPQDTDIGTIGLVKETSGDVHDYRNGTYCDDFVTNYFEIQWNPKRLTGSEISSNQDNIYIDIQVSTYNDEFDCPEDYSVISSADGQHWCFVIIWPVPPVQGFTFKEAHSFCNSTGASLPIVTSEDMNYSLWAFATIHFGVPFIWLDLICDPNVVVALINDTTESRTLQWQDGQPLEFSNFDTDQGKTCADSVHFAQRHDNEAWAGFNADYQTDFVICATRAVANPSFTPTTTQTTTAITRTTSAQQDPGLPAWAIATIIVSIILFCTACVGIILLVRRQKRLRAQIVEVQIDKSKQKDRSRQINSRYYDMRNEWEIERRFVSIESSRMLGEGAFGRRVLAKNIPIGVGRSIAELSALTNNNDTVAVKMLHENADTQREVEFRAEIELMKKIGYHERLVNMLACVTVSAPILLINEYCANGDLLNFMRQRRKFMLEHPDEIKAVEVITAKKQFMFSIQIAYGLEFLSSQGFIHRDIAARNIMVDKEESCKIGDFGLARSVGEGNENYHAQGGKLPLKWMSPEAIDKFFFSPASDVWSFGVLLFEIVTLGGTPYAGWPAAELLSRLKQGERMERPDNCTEQLYEVMCGCWHSNPSDRPTFAKLRKLIAHLLDDINQDDYYLKLNAHANYYLLESNASD